MVGRKCETAGCTAPQGHPGQHHIPMHQLTFNMKVVAAIAEIGNVVWALAKIRILEAAEQPGCARAAAELQRVSDRMVKSLKAIGVNTSRFEDYDTLQDAQQHPNN